MPAATRTETILITGASGAVGRYVVDELLARLGSTFVLVVRDAGRLPVAIRRHPRVQLCRGDIADGAALAAQLPPVDRAVFLATSWEGGEAARARAINVDGTLALAEGLRRRGAAQLVYFGTASILDVQGRTLSDALRYGSPYIASKAECRLRLLDSWPTGLVVIHPTLVVAGDRDRPVSHVARLIHEIERRAWLAQWITGVGSFHLVHAADLARMVRSALAEPADAAAREVIAGAPAILLREALDLFLERSGRRRHAAVGLTPARIEWLIRFFRVQLTEWDRLCLARGEFAYHDARLSLRADVSPIYPSARDIIGAVPHPPVPPWS